MMNDPRDISVLSHFTGILEMLEISYAIGGSIASSVYGQVRFTEDADITTEPFAAKAEEFFDVVKENYYISKAAMIEAIKRRSSFNVIDLETAFKIDIFICGESEYQKQLLRRRRMLRLSETQKKDFAFVSPEDSILLKLTWYIQGGSISEKQLNDIRGVLSVQKDALDSEYLKKWALRLEVADVLDRCLKEPG